MKNFKLFFISAIISLTFSTALYSQIQSSNIQLPSVPKFTITATVGYDYDVGSSNGDLSGFNMLSDQTSTSNAFAGSSYGMQSGVGIDVTGKMPINKKGSWKWISDLGYNLFYNTKSDGGNRSKWQIFNLGSGVEYSFKSDPNTRPFVGLEANCNIIAGGWQMDVTFPNMTTSNVYVKFRPAFRIGLSFDAGTEFKFGK